MKSKAVHLNRIAIIGCGHVGATSAYSILMNGTVEELVIVDEDREKLLGEVSDLQHAVPLAHPVRIWAGDYADAAQADIVVIAAGCGSLSGESRLDLLGRNSIVVRQIVRKLMRFDFNGIILMTTNPVDILAQIAHEESGLPFGKVIGSGTVLDTARLRFMLGEQLGIEANSVHAYIIGEHGDSEIATWTAARVGGAPLADFCQPDCPDFSNILEKVRQAAPEIVRRKGYTSFAIASCVNRICAAILRDEKTILPVSTMTNEQYGIDGVYLSLPCVIGRGGVEKIVEVPLDNAEREGLQNSARLLNDALLGLKNPAAVSAKN